MNRILLLLGLTVPFIHAQAQNVMFFHFGEKYDKVVENLRRFPADSIEKETQLKPLVAYYDGFIARYYFNKEERLYKIAVSKNYERKDHAKGAVSGALRYFEKIKATTQQSSNKGTKIYKVKNNERYYEMQEINYADNDIDIFLVGWNAKISPEVAVTEPVLTDAEALDVHDVREQQKAFILARQKEMEEQRLILAALKKQIRNAAAEQPTQPQDLMVAKRVSIEGYEDESDNRPEEEGDLPQEEELDAKGKDEKKR